jgi:hypothetical protein
VDGNADRGLVEETKWDADASKLAVVVVVAEVVEAVERNYLSR